MTNEINIPGLHKLEKLIFTINKPVIGKAGIYYQRLLKDWPLIVGEKIAKLTIPIRILTSRKTAKPDNTLIIATNNAATAAELIYHLNIFKEQINFYFGYIFIKNIKIVQAVFEVTKGKDLTEEPILNIQEQGKLDQIMNNYKENDNIYQILFELGKHIIKKEPRLKSLS